MRVKTIGSLGFNMQRPDVIDVPPRGMRGLGRVVVLEGTSYEVLGPDDMRPRPLPGGEAIGIERDLKPGQAVAIGDLPRDHLALVRAPWPWLHLAGAFGLGWIGGYLAWVAIGRRGGR